MVQFGPDGCGPNRILLCLVYGVVVESLSLGDDCTLRDDRRYRVQLHDDKVVDATEHCAEFNLVPPGYDCGKFLAIHGLDMSQSSV